MAQPLNFDVSKQMSSTKKGACILVSILIMILGPMVIPTWSTVTELGVKMICIFVGVLFTFMTTGDVFAGSLLGIIFILLHGYMSTADIWTNMFGGSVTGQMIFMMAFAGALRETGTMTTLGRWIIRKSGGLRKYPLLFNLVFTFCLYICSWHMTGLVCIFTLLPMYEGILLAVGYDRNDKFFKIMITGFFMFTAAASFGAGTGGLALGFVNTFIKSVTFEYEYVPLHFMLTARTGLAIFIILYILVARFVFRCDFSKFASIDLDSVEELSVENCTLRRQHYIMLVLWLLVMARAFISNPFATDSTAYTVYNNLSLPFMCMIVLIIACILKGDDGKPLANLNKCFQSVQWMVILSMGVFSILAGSFTVESTGIRPWLLSLLSPIFGGHSYIVFVFLVLLFTSVFTNLMSNQATVIIMITVVAAFIGDYVAEGINPTPLVAAINMVGYIPLLTYGASPQAPIYLNRPEMDKKFVYSTGLVMMALSVISLTIMTVVMGNIL